MKKSNSPKKIKRYRLGVSRNFPTTHSRKGEPTHFVGKIFKGLEIQMPCKFCKQYQCDGVCEEVFPKLHTIRSNYPLWEKRMKEVKAGRAVIELFYWEDKPYRSKQIVFAVLDKDSGCGVQELDMSIFLSHSMGFVNFKELTFSGAKEIDIKTLAKNDGLSLEDFKSWFKGYDLNETMAIIHFTSFRY